MKSTIQNGSAFFFYLATSMRFESRLSRKHARRFERQHWLKKNVKKLNFEFSNWNFCQHSIRTHMIENKFNLYDILRNNWECQQTHVIENKVVIFWSGVFSHGSIGRCEDCQLTTQVVWSQRTLQQKFLELKKNPICLK